MSVFFGYKLCRPRDSAFILHPKEALHTLSTYSKSKVIIPKGSTVMLICFIFLEDIQDPKNHKIFIFKGLAGSVFIKINKMLNCEMFYMMMERKRKF